MGTPSVLRPRMARGSQGIRLRALPAADAALLRRTDRSAAVNPLRNVRIDTGRRQWASCARCQRTGPCLSCDYDEDLADDAMADTAWAQTSDYLCLDCIARNSPPVLPSVACAEP